MSRQDDCSRTLLRENQADRANPLRGSYSVIANCSPGMGGFESDRIEARILDDHYLIVRTHTIGERRSEPVAICDTDKKAEAEQRMYQEALKITKETAWHYGNKFFNLTSRVKRSTEASFYEGR